MVAFIFIDCQKSIFMKGQMVFEFIIAGLFFFGIIIYSINYLTVNVEDFKGDFYQNLIQTKAIQISEIIMSESSSMGVVSDYEFNTTKIDDFNSTYCRIDSYYRTVKDFQLYEKTTYGTYPLNVNIVMMNSTDNVMMDCGAMIPSNVKKVEISRFGLYNGDIARMGIVVW